MRSEGDGGFEKTPSKFNCRHSVGHGCLGSHVPTGWVPVPLGGASHQTGWGAYSAPGKRSRKRGASGVRILSVGAPRSEK
jgi:hypothetical protein